MGQDTLLGGTIKRVKLDDGSYLNVLDDSNLADFIHHHVWFEGDEVALPREDRVYLLGNLTDAKETSSDTIAVSRDQRNVETEQHELDPDCNGADEMMTDETPLDNENGDDSETIVQEPLTSSQKKVIQNIHNNCGHPSKEELSTALRVRVSSVCSQRASSKAQTSSSVAADFSVQRNTWFGPFLGSSLQTIPKLFSATWCVGVVPIVYSCCGQDC